MTKLESLEVEMAKSEKRLREAHENVEKARKLKREAQEILAAAAKAYQDEIQSDPNRPKMRIGG